MLIITPLWQFVSSFVDSDAHVGIINALVFYATQWRFVLTFLILWGLGRLLTSFVRYVSSSYSDDSINIR